MGLGADLKYPFNEDGWYKTIGLGMVFEYFTWLVVPALFLAGYYIRVMQHTTAGSDEPPEFGDYGALAVDGIKAFAVLGVYLLIPMVVSLILYLPTLQALLNGNVPSLAGLLTAMIVPALIISLFAYGGIAGLVRFSRTGAVTSALSPSLLKVVFSGAWIKAWLKVYVTSGLSFLVSVLIALTGVGAFAHVVLIPFQVKYFFTVYARIFARAYASATPDDADLRPSSVAAGAAASGGSTATTPQVAADGTAASASTASDDTGGTAPTASDGTGGTAPTVSDGTGEATSTAQCQSCGEEIDQTVVFCPSCGSDEPFSASPEAGTAASAPAEADGAASAPAEADGAASAPAEAPEAATSTASRTTDDSAAPAASQTDAVTAAAETVDSELDPDSEAARRLCRTLADGGSTQAEVESAVADAVEVLDTTAAVTDTVSPAKRRSTVEAFETMRRNLDDIDGDLPSSVAPVVDRLVSTRRELDDQDDVGSEIAPPLETICQEAARSDAVTFQSGELPDRAERLATALRNGEVTLGERGTSLDGVADDVDRRVRPDSEPARQLLEELRAPTDESTLEETLTQAVSTLDDYGETQAMLAEISDDDVRRRLDSLERELQRHDTPVHSSLATRVRELSAMVDDGEVDDIQLYAIYQEVSFYDRTLLPGLDRAGSGGDSADVERRLETVVRRIQSIEDDYISVRADHNHSIPRHFLEVSEELATDADAAMDTDPQQAAGVLLATESILDGIEALYERNEYSVMLRRLRG